MRQAQHIQLGRGGNDKPYIGNGWSNAGDGFRWMVSPRSQFWLEHPGETCPAVLAMEIRPFTAPSVLNQRLLIRARGQQIFAGIIAEQRILGCLIPADVLQDRGPVCIIFEHPDAASPESAGINLDKRLLSFETRWIALIPAHGGMAALPIPSSQPVKPDEIHALTGQSADRFVTNFESLGDNCELGLVQRRCGAEPVSLLRFANMYLGPLLQALLEKFGKIGDPSGLSCALQNGGGRQEFILRDLSCHMTYHSGQFEGETTEQEVLAIQPARQRFLARKLLEDLQEGTKIMVLRRNPPLELPDVLAAFAVIRQIGPARLLWIALAARGETPGLVTEILPGLYRGALDRLAPDANAPDLSLESWLQVLVNTWKLAGRDHASYPAP